MTSSKQSVSKSTLKKVNYKEYKPLIDKARIYLKDTDTMKDLFKKHSLPISIIDTIPIMFKDIDTSAKTEGGIIYLSFKLLEDGDFYKDYSYLSHEITHFIQQCFGKTHTVSGKEDYLDNKFEIDGFKNQVKFLEEEFGSNKAEKYVDELLEYHDYKKNKQNKKEELLSDTQLSLDKQ